MDTDQYKDGTSPSLTLSPRIGISEYANANFFSEDTIFADQKPTSDKHFSPFPSSANVELFLDPNNNRKYWRKIGAVQEEPQHLAVVSKRFFWQQSAGADLPKRGRLDPKVHEDYARLLLPRAVGYTAALLDYFFRGKLDVDLVQPDSDNASFLQLIGANGSDDPLVDGTLTLYSDDPSGVRTAVSAVTSIPVNGVQKGQELFSAPVTFQAPENTERFVAVYQGTLGPEKKEGTFPGGVIGKVLGGVRVEEVFSDGVRWKLRTPKGVFLLPLMVAEFEEVRWGDGDNILVARTPLGPDQPSRVVVYEVQRQAGSVELVTVDTPDGREAQLVRKSEAIFPFGMSLGTTVTFSHTIHYRQQIAIYEPRRTVFAFKPLGELTVCQFDHFELGTPAVKTVATRDFPFQGSFPVTLDLARNRIFGTVNQPYIWDLREVGATADGRLLGLVVVSLTSPEGEAAFVPVIGLNQVTGVEEVVSQLGFSPTFPPAVGSPIWALVDLKTAEVVASTADRVLTITGEEAFEGFLDIWAHTEAIVCDQTFSAWSKLPFAQPRPGDIIQEDTAAQFRNGLFGLTDNGWLKNELNGLEVNGQSLFGVQLTTLQDSGDFIYDCVPNGQTSVCRAMRVTSITGVLARGPAGIEEVSRSRPAPGGERLVFLAGAGTGTTTPVATVFVWDATAGRARIRHQFLDVEDVPELGPATGGTLLASTLVLSGEQLVPRASFLIPLEGTQGPTLFPGVDLRESFVLLNPSYLYSVGDLKFFRPKPPLERIALPAKLADLPDRTNPVGDYHAIRLP